jgi:hypothetical protein
MAYDLTGLMFGELTVVRLAKRRPEHGGQYAWACKCSCGKKTVVTSRELRTGHTKSCGCLRAKTLRETATTHGQTNTPLHRVWSEMIQRCRNPNNSRYHRYGARGIKVCRRWREFENFVEDMGPRPEGMAGPRSVYSIERRDNNGHYCKKNCYWGSLYEQGANRSNNRLITYNGVTMHLAQWARDTGISSSVLFYRLRSGKKPPELFAPVRRKRK